MRSDAGAVAVSIAAIRAALDSASSRRCSGSIASCGADHRNLPATVLGLLGTVVGVMITFVGDRGERRRQRQCDRARHRRGAGGNRRRFGVAIGAVRLQLSIRASKDLTSDFQVFVESS